MVCLHKTIIKQSSFLVVCSLLRGLDAVIASSPCKLLTNGYFQRCQDNYNMISIVVFCTCIPIFL